MHPFRQLHASWCGRRLSLPSMPATGMSEEHVFGAAIAAACSLQLRLTMPCSVPWLAGFYQCSVAQVRASGSAAQGTPLASQASRQAAKPWEAEPRKSWQMRRRRETAALRAGLAEWQANPYYCAGRVTVPAILDTFACQCFFNRWGNCLSAEPVCIAGAMYCLWNTTCHNTCTCR